MMNGPTADAGPFRQYYGGRASPVDASRFFLFWEQCGLETTMPRMSPGSEDPGATLMNAPLGAGRAFRLRAEATWVVGSGGRNRVSLS